MDIQTKKTYEKLNIVSFIAMFMIINIHFFSHFTKYVDSYILKIVIYNLRAISIVAVPTYLAITGFTYIYLEKKINYNKILFYIIIPTLLFG